MERIYIIGGIEWHGFAEQHHAILLPFPEEDKHDFISANLKCPIKAVLIELAPNPAVSLEIAMHIRLSIEALHSGVLCPIVFISDLSKGAFLNYGYCSQLFLTDSIYVCPASKLDERMDLFVPLRAEEYGNAFLNKITIPPLKGYNHSLANQWGASVMSSFVSGGEELEEIRPIKNRLYFKYITACSVDNIFPGISESSVSSVSDSMEIDTRGKRILVIDDEADKGWESVLVKLFKSAEEIAFIKEKVPDFKSMTDEAKIRFLSPWDLFILDLRLGGDEEEGIYETNDFSGTRVLRLIKGLNRGNQVIMFTASNKAWNYKALLNAGADGYYIKESPEFKFSRDFSWANMNSFKQDVERCFNRGYLRDFFLFKKSIVPEDITGINAKKRQFLYETQNQLNMAFELADGARTEIMHSHAFVSTFQTFELVKNYYSSSVDSVMPIVESADFPYIRAIANNHTEGIVSDSRVDTDDSLFNKLSSVYLQSIGGKDDGFLFILSQLIRIRNAFIHKKKPIQGWGISATTFDQLSRDIVGPTKEVMSELFSKGYLIELWDGRQKRKAIAIKSDIISNKLGVELVIFCLKRFYN